MLWRRAQPVFGSLEDFTAELKDVPDIAALQVGRHLGVDVEFMKKRDNKNH